MGRLGLLRFRHVPAHRRREASEDRLHEAVVGLGDHVREGEVDEVGRLQLLVADHRPEGVPDQLPQQGIVDAVEVVADERDRALVQGDLHEAVVVVVREHQAGERPPGGLLHVLRRRVDARGERFDDDRTALVPDERDVERVRPDRRVVVGSALVQLE